VIWEICSCKSISKTKNRSRSPKKKTQA